MVFQVPKYLIEHIKNNKAKNFFHWIRHMHSLASFLTQISNLSKKKGAKQKI